MTLRQQRELRRNGPISASPDCDVRSRLAGQCEGYRRSGRIRHVDHTRRQKCLQVPKHSEPVDKQALETC